MTRPEIVFYSRTRFCPDVARSRARLDDLGLTWTEYNVEEDVTAAARVNELTGMVRVPTIVIGDRILVEPTNTALDEVLEEAGCDIAEEAAL